MRKRIRGVSSAVLLVALSLLGACEPPPQIAGSWETQEPLRRRTTYVFREDGTGFRIAGGRMEDFRYAIDPEPDPAPLDLWLRGPGGAERRVAGIVQLRGAAGLRIRLAPPGEPRPREFSRTHPGTALSRSVPR
ncbi:MAG: hypothetical protein ABW277_07785 [Longimicrobiaceae bacterium]